MTAQFYRALVLISDVLGAWFFVGVARGIALGYFLLKPTARKNGIRFYQTLFPGKGKSFYLKCTLRQFCGFTDVFADRIRLMGKEPIHYSVEGWEHLKNAVERREGAVLLMSHMGNWEAAAHLLHRDLKGMNLLLYMGIRQKEAIEGLQKLQLRQKGVRIVGVDEKGGSAFDVVEGIRFLKDGGFVSMAGDRVWRKDQRSVPGLFLGKTVQVPEAPFVFSLVSGKPLIFFFAFRIQNGRYHFTASKPLYLKPKTRSEREHLIQRAAQSYLDTLSWAAKTYPFQWYHFEDFFVSDCAQSDRSV
jgi:predicted LPLAT superfamily acyltransferase